MVYDWKIPMSVDAQSAGEELARIENKNGALTPESVLEESRAENAVLHDCFEWDDSIAAEKYRVNQARFIIRNIVTVGTISKDNTPKNVQFRAFVNVSDNSAGKFISIKTAMSNEDYKAQVLRNAAMELKAFKTKYQIYSELADVFVAADEFLAQFAE